MIRNKHYFPSIGEIPDCKQCERENCHSREKFQRSKLSFSYLSGRCPRTEGLYEHMPPEDAALIEGKL